MAKILSAHGTVSAACARAVAAQLSASSGWRERLPVLAAPTIALRELELCDAPALLAMLSTEDVTQFIPPWPATIDAVERFIVSTHHGRRRGDYLCFGVVPHGMSVPVGVFELRRVDAAASVATWKFAVGSAYWGTGVFIAGARMVVDFALSTLGVHRLEARVAAANGRGNSALRKLGATRECVLRCAFPRGEHDLDQVLWSIIDTDWVRAKALGGPIVRVH